MANKNINANQVQEQEQNILAEIQQLLNKKIPRVYRNQRQGRAKRVQTQRGSPRLNILHQLVQERREQRAGCSEWRKSQASLRGRPGRL